MKKNYILCLLAFGLFVFLIIGANFPANNETNPNFQKVFTNQISSQNQNIIFSEIPFQIRRTFEKMISEYDFLKKEPELLEVFKRAYPSVTFQSEYDINQNDWKIKITANNKSVILYWADGKFLPQEELLKKHLYSSFLYDYPKSIPNPKDFTEKDIKQIKEYTDPENRSENLGTPQFLYNLIYDVETRNKTESHIKSHKFLGKRTNVHEFICDKLDLIQAEIYAAAKEDSEVKSFVEKLDSADSYAWRSISDSGNRSYHSMGLAIDVLPKGWGQKNLYWAWRRDIDKKNWMMLDLDRRWMPPQKVIDIFEKNGFVWGGKWINWDNMHFEYCPEVILYNKIIEKN